MDELLVKAGLGACSHIYAYECIYNKSIRKAPRKQYITGLFFRFLTFIVSYLFSPTKPSLNPPHSIAAFRFTASAFGELGGWYGSSTSARC